MTGLTSQVMKTTTFYGNSTTFGVSKKAFYDTIFLTVKTPNLCPYHWLGKPLSTEFCLVKQDFLDKPGCGTITN
jgi:hypothetical protein